MRLHIAVMAALLLFYESTVVATTTFPTVDEVLTFTPDKQFEYLSQLSPEVLVHYQRNSEELARLLLEIAGQTNSASELAMHHFNWFVLILSSNSCAPNFIALTESEYIDQKLTQLITQPEFDIKVRRGSILAHSNLFPPTEQLLEFYKVEIESINLDERGLIENILIALNKYRSTSGIELPTSVEKKLPEFVHHHSGGVRSQAIIILASLKGLDYLPDLFEMLKSSNYNSSKVIVTSILSIDSSQSTVDRLRVISNGLEDGSLKKKLIDRSVLPENLERLKKKGETSKSRRNAVCAQNSKDAG